MLVIKCSKCKTKIMKYKKIGAGHVLRCYKDRISRWYLDYQHGDIVCQCGEIIGCDEGNYFRMKQHSFTCSGKVIK